MKMLAQELSVECLSQEAERLPKRFGFVEWLVSPPRWDSPGEVEFAS
jgi:hypothetical protein